VDGVGPVWVFAHYESGISQLALRNSGVDCGDFLWLDLAKNGVDFCVGDCARVGGRHMALLVQDRMKRRDKGAFRASVVTGVPQNRNISPIQTY
jgi:hypothetical protein